VDFLRNKAERQIQNDSAIPGLTGRACHGGGQISLLKQRAGI
jgi:hypothetical protein